MTLSSRPLIQRLRRLANLYLNIGHGMLGWTLALGAAHGIAMLIAKDRLVSIAPVSANIVA